MSELRVVGEHGDPESARAQAARLVEAGIGATVDLAPADADAVVGDGPPIEHWVVQVLPEDHVRACELLGLPAPEPDPEDERTERPPWRTILMIWLVAMIVFPALAFWLTVQLAD